MASNRLNRHPNSPTKHRSHQGGSTNLTFYRFLPLVVFSRLGSYLQATKNPATTTSTTATTTQTQAPTPPRRVYEFYALQISSLGGPVSSRLRSSSNQERRNDNLNDPNHHPNSGTDTTKEGLRTLRFTDFLPSPAC